MYRRTVTTMSYTLARLFDRALPLLAAIQKVLTQLQAPATLAARIFVGLAFFRSGLTKIADWETTLALFADEYHVPLLPAPVAAVAGTFGELFFPVLLILGLFGRPAAVGLFAVNVMAVVSYAHVLLAPGFEGAVGQHYLWGFMLLTLAVYGPGRYSVDHLFASRWFGRQD